MDTKISFIVYCIEEYKHAKGMTGKSVIEATSGLIMKRCTPLAGSILWMISVNILRRGRSCRVMLWMKFRRNE